MVLKTTMVLEKNVEVEMVHITEKVKCNLILGFGNTFS